VQALHDDAIRFIKEDMRIRVPGWLLIGGSIVATLLLGVRIEYIHLIDRERVQLAAARRQIANGAEFETFWKKLAAATYESGRNDPALMDLLRKCDITVQVKNAPAPNPPVPATLPSTTPPLDPSTHAAH
jgi:hypothetical protein